MRLRHLGTDGPDLTDDQARTLLYMLDTYQSEAIRVAGNNHACMGMTVHDLVEDLYGSLPERNEQWEVMLRLF